MHPVTLALSPPELEAAFWREAGTPTYALSDRFGLAFTSANHVFLWWAMRTLSQAERMLDACPAIVTAVANANHLASLYVALAAFAASLALPARYRAVREPLAVGQRLVRAVNTPVSAGPRVCTAAARKGLGSANTHVANRTAAPTAARAAAAAGAATVCAPPTKRPGVAGSTLPTARCAQIVQGCTSAAAYHRRIGRDLAGAGGAPMAPSVIVIKHASLLGVLWGIQVLVFAFRLRWAAPIQAAAAVAGVFAMHGFACAARAQPAVSEAAAQLCGWVEAVSGEALAPAWPRLSAPWGLCTDGAVEFLVVLIAALSSSLSVSARGVSRPATGSPPAGWRPAAGRWPVAESGTRSCLLLELGSCTPPSSARNRPQLYILYCREQGMKQQYLNTRALADEAGCQGGTLPASGLRHATAVACCAVGSFFVADAVASFGWRFRCA
jgi:hypothetical protein